MKRVSICLSVVLFLLLAVVETGFTQIDLTTAERVTVKVDGNDEAVTILQDYSKKKQWYFVPNRPRLVEGLLGGRKTPVFNLIRYQFRKGQDFDTGGIMQFAINFELPGSAINRIKAHIAQKMTTAQESIGPQDINLVALPLNDARFYLYSPGGEKMMSSDTPSEGMAPTFASQNIPFSLSLTENGASVFDTIVTDTLGGVPVIVVMEYTGITAPAGFRCTVNWDVTYRRLQHDAKLGAALSGVPYVTPKIDAGYSNLRAQLEKQGCIKLEVIEGSGFNLADADKYLQPILTIMAREMLENPAAPSEIPAPVIQQKNPVADIVQALSPSATKAVEGQAGAAAAAPGLPSVSVSLSYTMKDEKLVRKGKQTYDMNVRRAMTQSTVCGGFIGIGQYPKEVQESVVLVVPGDQWEKAYLSLPRIVHDEVLNIQGVTLTAALSDGRKSYDQQVASWSPEKGWTGLDTGGDAEIRRFAFATLALKAALGDKWQDSFFKLESSITYKPQLVRSSLTFKGETQVKLFSGNAPVSSPLDSTELWLFDAGYLFFAADDPSSKLQRVDIRVSSDGQSDVRVSIDPARNEARVLPVLVDRQARYVRATISFSTGGSRPVQWEFNGKNLKEIPDFQGGMVFLSDWDWLK